MSKIIISNGVLKTSLELRVNKELLFTVPSNGCLKIPPNVITVKGAVFSENNSKIKTLTVPDSTIEIDYNAFYDCKNLTEVTFGTGLVYLGEGSFKKCLNLEKVTFLGNNLIEIADSAFENCSALKELKLPQGTSTLGTNTFNNCSSLKTVSIPDSICEIPSYAFNKCIHLEAIRSICTVAAKSENQLEKKVLRNADATPAANCSLNVTNASDGLTLPQTIEYIRDYAFNGCISLKSVTLPQQLKEIGESCFAYCSSLRDAILPQELKQIGNSAFYNCIALTNVILPQSVSKIEDHAFSGCRNLKTVHILNPDLELPETTFNSVPNLTITASAGSKAIEFAKAKNIKFNIT